MKKVRFLDLFSGIGATHESFSQLKEESIIENHLTNYCEYDDKIAKMYSILHNVSVEKNLGDITKVNEKELSDFDFVTFGFPCQDISALGDQKGLFDKDENKTRSGLFFDAIRIIKEKQPKIAIAENVKALLFQKNRNDFNLMLEEMNNIGYNVYYEVLTPVNFGIPHSRQRVFIVMIRKDVDDMNYTFPEGSKLENILLDFKQDDIKDDYYLNDLQIKNYAKNEMRLKKKYSSLNSEIAICMTTKQGKKSNPQNFIEDEKGVRILTPKEMFKLQGFNENKADKLTENGYAVGDIGFVMGNSLSVAIMKELIKSVLKYL